MAKAAVKSAKRAGKPSRAANAPAKRPAQPNAKPPVPGHGSGAACNAGAGNRRHVSPRDRRIVGRLDASPQPRPRKADGAGRDQNPLKRSSALPRAGNSHFAGRKAHLRELLRFPQAFGILQGFRNIQAQEDAAGLLHGFSRHLQIYSAMGGGHHGLQGSL